MAAVPAALLLLAIGAVRGQSRGEAELRVACASLVQRAQALPSIPLEADLAAGGRALLREARSLSGWQVRGVPLQLPWIADLDLDFGPDKARPALEAAAQKLAGRLYFTCGVIGEDPSAPVAVDRARLAAILSRPEYERRSPDETLLYQLMTRAAAWLRDLFSENAGLQATATSVRALFLLAVCLLAALLALRMARAALGRGRPRAPEAEPEAIALEDPETYRAGAGAALSARDGREAIRLGLLTLVATLERLHLVSPGRAATNRELAEQIAARGGTPELARRARQLVAAYDRAWYGLSPVSPDEARAIVDETLDLCACAAAERGVP